MALYNTTLFAVAVVVLSVVVGPRARGPAGRQAPLHGLVPDDLLPAGDHADGADGDRLEVDLRRQHRHPELRAVLVGIPPVAWLTARRRPLGDHHHERLEGARATTWSCSWSGSATSRRRSTRPRPSTAPRLADVPADHPAAPAADPALRDRDLHDQRLQRLHPGLRDDAGLQAAPGAQLRVLVFDIYQNGFQFFNMGYASAEAVVLTLIVLGSR